MTAKKGFLFVLLPMCQLIVAQRDSIVSIREVSVSDHLLKKFSRTLSIVAINDSIIEKNGASLTSLLNYNTTIYFKENGLGMVSSPSFRGTTAQQTAVIWNGININSQLTGQTDFNTITTGNFDDITVRAGGGSAIYGSGAIGGSIHLNNELQFVDRFTNELRMGYGSFESYNFDYNIKASNKKTSVNAGISRNSSVNDYEYLETNGKHNENGQFYNTSVNADFGYRINKHHAIKFYSQVFEGERHFSGTITTIGKSKYQNLDTRNLLEWEGNMGRFNSKFKLASVTEKYKYFPNFKLGNFETSQAETSIIKYDLAYTVGSKMNVDAIVDYSNTKGLGSNIGDHRRETYSASLLYKHNIFKQLQYEASIRKEFAALYESPLLFAFGINAPLGKTYRLRANVSRNFRAPTFNDLFWQSGGNLDLKPEHSLQAELGQEFTVRTLIFGATVYYNKVNDLIRWSPKNGIWSPENIGKVNAYGAELSLRWHLKINNHLFSVNALYAYSVSKDAALNQQLTFVPFHKFTGSVAYYYKKITFDYQYLFNGSVYTIGDHSAFLKEYMVSNVEVAYSIGRKNTCRLGFRTQNIWNEKYQSVPSRPFPGRNYLINITLKS